MRGWEPGDGPRFWPLPFDPPGDVRDEDDAVILDFSDTAHAERHGSGSTGQPADDGFVPYLHDYVDRAEQRGYSRREIVERLLELLEQVSSEPALPGRGW